jgi:creatinine amidohydrolase/Fe(II)-dependent formamide hydrolase-like protein
MLLHLSTWQEVETYLQTSPGIIIPIGSTEQHGPSGLIVLKRSLKEWVKLIKQW